jgi:hypothetical protein
MQSAYQSHFQGTSVNAFVRSWRLQARLVYSTYLGPPVLAAGDRDRFERFDLYNRI